jgi:acetyltransferase-like isoleucine patch superfamily enzyme
MKEYYVHPSALCESDKVGKNTRIWAFAHILKDVVIGEDCNLCDYTFIESGARIGNRVTIKNGISIWDGVTIEDDVFLGPNCVLTNDTFPRSKIHFAEYEKTLIKQGASIGANATILCGIVIGKYCMIGAGAVVTKSVPDFALMAGNPARFRYWISKTGQKLEFKSGKTASDIKGNKYKLNINEKDNIEYVTEI